ncbi:flagellar protein [Thalassotalea insulae]|uniref:Flagellar protein n=1 Tax=Thalassotalea insulae TaxID=2056778 RepID=A0ABQ6GQK1_9GAMM|nr:flagellar biosynthetic protein FliO [Thalassotalea insulae]GLX77614.1 flagellar protein [Thalassotalea insulae]
MTLRNLVLLIVTFFSCVSLGQEETVQVGKHANVNLDAMSMIMSLLMVLVLIIVSAWLLKKFNLTNHSVAGMKVIASLPLGTKEKLVVVQVGEQQLLLAVSQQQVSLIKTLEQPLDIAMPVTQEFNQTVSRFFNKSRQDK